MKLRRADRNLRPELLRYEFFGSKFGQVLIALEPESKCVVWISLVLDKSRRAKKANLEELQSHWKPGHVEEGIGKIGSRKVGFWIFREGADLMMRGTDFQIAVWEELIRTPLGKTTTYSGLAAKLGHRETHARAVAGAVAANTIAVLVPCHRVIGKDGDLCGYRWGIARKRMILDWEEAVTGKPV